jgi:predicted small integral membrane protein
MGDLLARATHGVDLSSPGAAWQVFNNLMAAMPWTALLWFTLFSLVLGAVVGWWRGRLWSGIWISLVIGPIALLVLFALPSRRTSRTSADDPASPR